MRVLATIAGKSAFEIGVKPGSTLSAHATAQGKLLLAFGGDAAMDRVLAKSLPRSTPSTITERAPLRAELEQVRRQGWAIAPNQAVIGLNALAAPIFDALGTFVGAIAIVDSIQFIPEDPAAKQIRQTVEAGKRISTTIGFRGPYAHAG
jgi:DNA-binding IclR family transcriptional regulator